MHRTSSLFSLLALSACATFEITNDSMGDVEVAIGTELMFESTDPEDVPTPFTVQAGATSTQVVNIPLNVSEAQIRANGDWVNLIDTVTVAGDDETTFYTIVDNAGAARITNSGTTPIQSIHFTSTATMDDEWAFGLGDWGPDLGPIAPGESVELTGLFPGEEYNVKFDGTVRIAPQYTITVGEYTDIAVSNDDE